MVECYVTDLTAHESGCARGEKITLVFEWALYSTCCLFHALLLVYFLFDIRSIILFPIVRINKWVDMFTSTLGSVISTRFRLTAIAWMGVSTLFVFMLLQPQAMAESLAPASVVIKKIRRDQSSIPIDISGRLHHKTEIKLAFKTGGLVYRMLVDEGEFVERGQLLARLDFEEVEAAVARAEAAYQKAKRDVKRVARLNQKNVISKQKLQDSETEVTLREADLKVAKFNRKYSRIRAPVSGYILNRLVEKGELVQPGQTIFVVSSGDSGWIIRAGLIDRDIIRVSLNDPVEVSMDAYPRRVSTGKVTEISQIVDPKSGVFSVEISLDDTDQVFFSGMVASAVITPQKLQALFYIPIESLVDSNINGAQVYLFDRETSRVEKVSVGISFLYQNEVAVSSGLEEHHEVVLAGVKRLESGDLVHAVDQQGFPVTKPQAEGVDKP